MIYVLQKEINIGRLSIKLEWRSKKSRMGRFGGGWNWKLGFQSGGSTVIISLLVLTIAFRLNEKPEHPCPHCGKEMQESIIGADCSGGSHREINGWYCEPCDYSEKERE